ncbi:hypothetical protein [Mucilaginibacter polytrichastri]|uniref:hypothetical protein n=1 Tax=Mucilaginibacter polytrichastri TaxID=1302689 RepID=UPI0008F02A5F|nr:hypothetical protein [Mucilaginibacter polytrichastri]SFT05968.1 hypothetical protein SAMN04487890_109143 [Mucilaginibacter polytrichastri]
MSDFNYDSSSWNEANKVHTGRREFNLTAEDKKSLNSKKIQKTYTVTVTYIQLTEELAKTKLAIIESIMKKGYKK